MKNTRKALEMAIETLETAEIQSEYDGLSNIIFKAIQACKEALEQPAWQGLTEDEILAIPVGSRLSTARAIEQELKEKNT
jgi:hypothetical protein